MKNLLITICARGGSKGIPMKNIRDLVGIPLISYTYNHALQFSKWLEKQYGSKTKIELSTDSGKIIKVCESLGLFTNYLRPDFLSNDTAGKLDAIKDVILFSEKETNVEYDYILDLDVSAPMRTLEDLKEAWEDFLNNKEAKNLFSVSNAQKNPYFNMVEKNKSGYYELSKKSKAVLSRQSAPKVYELNASFYFYRRSFYNCTPLSLINNSLIYEMKHISFDLDEIIDFEFLDFLISNNKLSFTI
jgi:CMP-N-acetylneuraminic acid synthetase|tara:strand:+ start:11371 stop:12105 length:735 start_codon:yes stop_codon:yes gene_type:complete